jgi:hypothetical protein
MRARVDAEHFPQSSARLEHARQVFFETRRCAAMAARQAFQPRSKAVPPHVGIFAVLDKYEAAGVRTPFQVLGVPQDVPPV